MSALSGVSLTAMPDEARGVYGRSGAGKSILLRVMAGIESPDSGRIESHGSSAMSYAEPRLDDAMTPKETLELHCALYGIPRRKRRSAIRDTLVLLDLESVCDRRISVLTSGERKQLELARVLISPSPTLLLDEPINHLDIPSRASFEQAMTAFEGTVLAVVHDRYFIRQFATGVWAVENGTVRGYVDLDDYQRVRQPNKRTNN